MTMKEAIKALFDKDTANDVDAIATILELILSYVFDSFISKEAE